MYPNADKARLHALGTVLRNLRNSPCSNFYRDRFSGLPHDSVFPGTLEAWQSLPLLAKEEISQAPLWERTFVPPEQVFIIRYTGGTSGKKTLLTPRRTFGAYGRASAMAGARRMLSFMAATFMSEALRREIGIKMIYCHFPDTPKTFALASRLAKDFAADSLFILPSTALELAPYLSSEGALSSIRVLEFSGERRSIAQEKALRQLYPDAAFVQNYSASEWNGTFGESCSYAIQEKLMSFHIDHHFFFSEFIDPDTGNAADLRRGPGELVISSLKSDQPLPLIRYRTGDLLEVETWSCPCGDPTPRFRYVERIDAERARLFSVEFSVDAIEQALAACPELKAEDFEAHYIEGEKRTAYAHGLKLFVVPRGPSLDLAEIARKLEENVRITSVLTYREGVKSGLLLPLEVAILNAPMHSSVGKRIRLIRVTE